MLRPCCHRVNFRLMEPNSSQVGIVYCRLVLNYLHEIMCLARIAKVDAFEDYSEDDNQDKHWRGRVTQVLIENQLLAKSNRVIACSH
jgi:hypothetical protein